MFAAHTLENSQWSNNMRRCVYDVFMKVFIYVSVQNECPVEDCSRRPDRPRKMPGCRLKRWVFKTCRDNADMMWCDSSFQTRAAATRKLGLRQSTTVYMYVWYHGCSILSKMLMLCWSWPSTGQSQATGPEGGHVPQKWYVLPTTRKPPYPWKLIYFFLFSSPLHLNSGPAHSVLTMAWSCKQLDLKETPFYST